MKKYIYFLLLFILNYSLFAQYTGGSQDGYNKKGVGKSPIISDSIRLNIGNYGGNYDGYGAIVNGKSPIMPNSTRLNYPQSGGYYDGYGAFVYGKSPIMANSIRLNYMQLGGDKDGYSAIILGKSPIKPDSTRLNYIQIGGFFDGYGKLITGRSPIIPDLNNLNLVKKGGNNDGYGFQKVGINLNQPILKFPSNNAQNMDSALVMKWELLTSFDAFHIQISKFINFSSLVVDNKQVTADSLSVLLNRNTNYYWRVRSIKTGDTSNWSDIWIFRTENGPFTNVPVLNYPADNSGFILSNCQFGWNIVDNADSYEIQFSKYANFSNVAKVYQVNDSSVIAYDLSKESRYYWRVRAKNRLYTSSWSDVWQFTTSVGAINGVCNLISPTNNTVKSDTALTFKWGKLANALKYNLIIYLNDTTTIAKSIETSDSLYHVDGLNYGKNYKWCVKAFNNADTSERSSLWDFSTKTYSIPVAWNHQTSSSNQSIVQLPTSLVCKVSSRNIDDGDAIGVFYTRNDSLFCSGYGLWEGNTLNITVYGDWYSTLLKDGFLSNELYYYKFWDGKEGKEYLANAIYHSGSSNRFSNGILSVVDTFNVITSVKHYLKLNQGWNLVSSYVKPQNDSIQVMWDSVKDNLVIMKNNAGKSYIPAYNINDIKLWVYSEAYRIYMSKADTLIIEGVKADLTKDFIVTKSGWNLISYLNDANMNITGCLSTLTDRNSLVIAKNNAGKSYIPAYSINDIGDMLPGQGYQIYMNTLDTIVYPQYPSGGIPPPKVFGSNSHYDFLNQIIESKSIDGSLSYNKELSDNDILEMNLNKAKNYYTLEYFVNNDLIQSIKLKNLTTGKELDLTERMINGFNKVNIGISELKNGTYVVECLKSNGSKTSKIVIIK